MPRYFFDVETKTGAISDVDGVEMQSLSAAHQEAEQAARDLLARAILKDLDPPIEVIVYDDHRQKVARVMLRDLIPTMLR